MKLNHDIVINISYGDHKMSMVLNKDLVNADYPAGVKILDEAMRIVVFEFTEGLKRICEGKHDVTNY